MTPVLNGYVRINPFNLEHVVEQLDASLLMARVNLISG